MEFYFSLINNSCQFIQQYTLTRFQSKYNYEMTLIKS